MAEALLRACRASPLASLQVENRALQRVSLFDTVPAALKARVVAALDALNAPAHVAPTPPTAADLVLARARGCMVGMALADSLGHNFGTPSINVYDRGLGFMFCFIIIFCFLCLVYLFGFFV